MRCIVSPENNPQFNLAAEEYLFRNYSDDLLFLYVNSPSVVVGKHQNALAEINPVFIRENNVQVIRRLSGGGAVYHDLGNLNFSFHQTVADTAKISFKSFNQPIIEVLKEMGVPAEISQRNDIFVNGFKVSGHAEHVFRNRILSHGTLLFNADRKNLSIALKNESGKFSGKAIQSVRSKVANISDFLTEPMEIKDFIGNIVSHFLASNTSNIRTEISETDREGIEKLVHEKYATWEWNLGYSPKYRFEKKIAVDNNFIAVEIQVEKGKITSIELKGDAFDSTTKKAIQQQLLNSLHDYQIINTKLKTLNLKYTKQLIDCLF